MRQRDENFDLSNVSGDGSLDVQQQQGSLLTDRRDKEYSEMSETEAGGKEDARWETHKEAFEA